MDLDNVWKIFMSQLNSFELIEKAEWKKITGIPFLYIRLHSDTDQELIAQHIRFFSAKAMKGKRLHSETTFVRSEELLFVYRHRFYVPQQKMFCCGNICDDCIRLQPAYYY